ncbi:MAG: DNA-3-methyladenine glycosylase 2 family protein [Defluviitaleaceae bacterium]|nr:DNA-3-methyladenine glycosylase 2 family protein [Defluviitaleaceae bacterium]
MDYLHAEQRGDNTVLTDTRFFDLAQTLDNGQAFRWCESGKNEFSGIAHGRRMTISYDESGILTLKDTSLEEFERIWKRYFDLTRDYGKLRTYLSESAGEFLYNAIEHSPGLRLMRQDVWEVLVSFILSQNSNIPRIKKMVEAICINFGEKLPCGGHTFPTPKALASLSENDLADIKSGYRAAYILDAARKTASGEFSPTELENLPSDEIYKALLNIHGVGPKVAECVLLYGFGRVERYPIDVWIKRTMEEHIPEGFSDKTYQGIAQQYVFHYARRK